MSSSSEAYDTGSENKGARGDKRTPQQVRGRWLHAIKKSEDARKEFEKQARNSWRMYQMKSGDGEADNLKPMFPIWWSTVQVERSALFARMPLPDVRPRYTSTPEARLPPMMPPPPGAPPELQQAQQQQMEQLQMQRQAEAAQTEYQKQIAAIVALIPQRAIAFTLDTRDLRAHADRAVNDFLVSDLGVCKVEWHTKNAPQKGEDGKPVLSDPDDPKSDPLEQIAEQYACFKYFPWDRVVWDPSATCWEEVQWVAFKHWFTPAEIRQEFGVDLAGAQGRSDTSSQGRKKGEGGICAWELWDKKTRRLTWISDAYADGPLSDEDDPLRLQGFFPCAKPLMVNVGPDTLTPQPDYVSIESLDKSIQRKTARIHVLAAEIKDVGFYDGELTELATLRNSEDGQLVPIKNLAERLMAPGGSARITFDNVVSRWDNSNAIQTIQVLGQEREVDKSQIFETLGIADIIRGASQASETATAQGIKSQWASVRLSNKQAAIAQWFRDSYRIMAELFVEHATPETLYLATGIQPKPEWLEMLRSDLGRTMLIDVETDATVAIDVDAQKQSANDLINAVVPLLPVAQQAPDIAKELILLAIEPFKAKRSLQEAIEKLPSTAQQLQSMQQQIEQQTQQMEQMQKALQDAQAKLAQVDQAKMQADTIKAQADGQRAQADAVIAQQRNAIDAAKERREAARTGSEIQSARVHDELTVAQTEKTIAETHGALIGAERDARTPIDTTGPSF